MNKKKIIRILFGVYLIVFVAFIFSNSLPSIEESAASSGRVLKILNNILDFFGLPIMTSDLFIRKAGHFIEFFILGTSVFVNLLLYKSPQKSTVVNCIFGSCLVAMTDETIQHFSKRGSMLLDVWLDLFGGNCYNFA